ncbi:hypothetical protein Tco_0823740 [Tanacetum coccineum]|uniref:Uncharacterized protein n=1 Tax=Tanacetum coccineum TaxID=301880 RepID=A0ABQ5AIQ1_9ASTR
MMNIVNREQYLAIGSSYETILIRAATLSFVVIKLMASGLLADLSFPSWASSCFVAEPSVMVGVAGGVSVLEEDEEFWAWMACDSVCSQGEKVRRAVPEGPPLLYFRRYSARMKACSRSSAL